MKALRWIPLVFLFACGDDDAPAANNNNTPGPDPEVAPPEEDTPEAAASPLEQDSLANALLIPYAQFEVEGGQVTATPGPARLEVLQRQGGEWVTEVLEDDESRVFHKAMLYQPRGSEPGILTLGGLPLCGDDAAARDCQAQLKLWRRTGGSWSSETLWETDFGGQVNRMRDAEVGNVLGDGVATIAVATHDQGVVALVQPGEEGYEVTQLDEQADRIVHEIELGDLDSDGAIEVYATPSERNNLEGREQSGVVVRYVPSAEGAAAERTVVADLGNRHAKEILVEDVDGDGTDELYVAVEALMNGQEIAEPVEIRRYDADTAPTEGVVIATIPDRQLRFLTAGDLDGDGKKEMVAAAFRSGLWMLRPGRDPRGEWSSESIDRDSSGFEHAATAADLDEDGTDELYVAADEQGELRAYVWRDGRLRREVIHRRELARSMLTWNIMPVPARLVRASPN